MSSTKNIIKNFIVIIFLCGVLVLILSQIPFVQNNKINECDGLRFFSYCKGNSYEVTVETFE
ncbi:MAG: hypothetical protein ACOZAO_05295 [Patescibacteria group bacterium]